MPATWCRSDCHVSPGLLSLEDRFVVLYCLSNCLLSTDLRASCCYQHTIHGRSFVANEEVLEIPSLAILLIALLVGALLWEYGNITIWEYGNITIRTYLIRYWTQCTDKLVVYMHQYYVVLLAHCNLDSCAHLVCEKVIGPKPDQPDCLLRPCYGSNR